MSRILGLGPATFSDHPPDKRPVVLIGPYEHHSNELPWRESAADVVVVPLDERGHIDLAVLKSCLSQYEHRPLRSDVSTITKMLHKHGFFSFWDSAAAAPMSRLMSRALIWMQSSSLPINLSVDQDTRGTMRSKERIEQNEHTGYVPSDAGVSHFRSYQIILYR